MSALTSGLAVLDGAIGYALGGAARVTPEDWSRPTPCAAWDLATLVDHVAESMGLLHDALGCDPADRLTNADPVARLRAQAARLLAVCAPDGPVRIGDRELPASMVVVTGALEIAVHAWDIWAACGVRRPIPPGLAIVLQPVAPLLVPACARPGLFADPVPLTGPADAAGELLAFLGRKSF